MIKKIISFCLVFEVIFSLMLCVFSEEDTITYYVSPNGNDSYSGEEASPLKTLEVVKAKIRSNPQRGKKKIDVIFEEGYYNFSDTVEFTSKDSGSKEFPVTYKAREGRNVVFEGGVELSYADANIVTDEDVLKRLNSDIKDKIKVIDLKKYGVEKIPEQLRQDPYLTNPYSPLRFYIDEKEISLSRWPNDDEWVKTGKIIDPGVPHEAGRAAFDGRGGTFEYRDERIESWATFEDVWVYGQFAVEWAPNATPIKSVDKEKNSLTTVYNAPYAYSVNALYYYFNVLEELDSEGEFYVDKKTCKLYFYDNGINEKSSLYITYIDKPFVNLEYSQYINFENIIFQGTRGNGITANNCRGVRFYGCTIRFIGLRALSAEKGYEYIVDNCLIYECGAGGIYLIDGGNKKYLKPSGNRVLNCHIYNFSQWKQTYSPAITASGTYDIVANNELHGGTHMALTLGTGSIAEYNDIYDMLRTTDDAGVIYQYCDGSVIDTHVRYNFVHSSAHRGVIRGTGCWGYYLDGFTSGQRAYGNIFYDLPGGIHVNGGQNNDLYNNLFINCETGIYSHAFTSHGADDFWKRCDPYDCGKGIWNQRYPELYERRDNNPFIMFKDNHIENNISVNVYRNIIGTETDPNYPSTNKNNITLDQSIFNDYENLDFSFKDSAMSEKYGIVDLKKVGRNKRTYEEIEAGALYR